MRYAARTDANQAEIAAALRAAGATVWYIKLPVDLLVGFRGKTMLMEVKTKKGKHTAYQESFMGQWTGGPVSTVRDVEGALRALEMLKVEVRE